MCERIYKAKWVKSDWLTPFLKQSFVTAGVSLNCGQFGVVAAYVVAIVPQLKEPGAPIYMDDDIGSWFASIHGLSLLLGYLIVVKIINDYGRRIGSIISSALALTGWLFILLAENLSCLLMGRFLQGLSLGLCLALGPMLIAECTSPRHRGLFISTTTGCMSFASVLIHWLASHLHWRTTALVCTLISFVDLLICLYSPESPSWLATQGRFDECKKVFRWLRGDNEDDELFKLIKVNVEANAVVKTKCESINSYFVTQKAYIIEMLKKREVYIPLANGIHLYIICYWSGLSAFTSYPIELIHKTVGENVETRFLILSLDLVRMSTSILGLYIVKKIKRRTMLFYSVGLNIICLIVIAGYVYAKEIYVSIDMPILTIIFLHIQVFTISIGALPLPTVICGEIFPLQYRSLTTAITRVTSAVHVFLVYKSFPDIVRGVGLGGCYCILAGLISYALIVCYNLLPETKDKTLQDIEEELRGDVVKTDNSAESFL